MTTATPTDETPCAPPPKTLRFERRRHDRWPDHGVAEVYRLGGERFGEQATLTLKDFCEDGLGATADKPIEPGAYVSIGFRAPGRPVRRGIVLRCRPTAPGYAIAIQFERPIAA